MKASEHATEIAGSAAVDSPEQGREATADHPSGKFLESVAKRDSLTDELRLKNAAYEFSHRQRKRELDAYRRATSNWRLFFWRSWVDKEVTAPLRTEEKHVRQSGLLDPEWYGIRYPEAKKNPFRHYVTTGALDGVDPHPMFDTDWYLKNNRYPRRNGINPLVHYVTKGWKNGRSPHPLFDVDWYLNTYSEVARRGVEPLNYYLREGWRKGHKPHPLIDPQWYLDRYPDVRDAELEPLTHFLTQGVVLGYTLSPRLRDERQEGKAERWRGTPDFLAAARNHYSARITHEMRRALNTLRASHPDARFIRMNSRTTPFPLTYEH